MSQDSFSQNNYWRPDSNERPRLFLAPMEGLGDSCFRQAISQVGGFDEATTDFLRIPQNAHVKSLIKQYDPYELGSLPIACQIMGQDPDRLALATLYLGIKGAPRVDLNCGCPSNTVVGRKAGSSLLRDPDQLYHILRRMTAVAKVPVSVKIRSGYEDTLLFEEILLAIEDAKVSFVTIHPRTKQQGYKGSADWELIAKAKQHLRIPVIGNGDILSVEDGLRLLKLSACDGLMIGRGAVMKPWIFNEFRAHFSGSPKPNPLQQTLKFLHHYKKIMEQSEIPGKNQINKFKQCLHYLFQNNLYMLNLKKKLLQDAPKNPQEFYQELTQHLNIGFSSF